MTNHHLSISRRITEYAGPHSNSIQELIKLMTILERGGANMTSRLVWPVMDYRNQMCDMVGGRKDE